MTVSKFDDVIDSRDVIARIEELESDRDCIGDPDDAESETDADAIRDDLATWDADNGEELAELREFASRAEDYVDGWRHGAQLIHDDHFKDYARQYAEEVGAVSDDARWPCTCIDWEAAASELQQDYSVVEFGGQTYWVR
jgi:hypothetical protein